MEYYVKYSNPWELTYWKICWVQQSQEVHMTQNIVIKSRRLLHFLDFQKLWPAEVSSKL